MSWGIAETASEIEKIKSESADYLNGLNSCGVIDWNTYNYAFDFYADLLMKAYKQGKKDARPNSCEDAVSRADVEVEIANILKGVFVEYQDIAKKAAAKLSSVTPKRKTMICGACPHSDSDALYATNPPMIQCKKTGEMHFTTDICNCENENEKVRKTCEGCVHLSQGYKFPCKSCARNTRLSDMWEESDK